MYLFVIFIEYSIFSAGVTVEYRYINFSFGYNFVLIVEEIDIR